MNLTENHIPIKLLDVATIETSNIGYPMPYDIRVYYLTDNPESKLAAEEMFWKEYSRRFRIDCDIINKNLMNTFAMRHKGTYFSNMSLGYPRK